jgi:mannose-6-phosphate isomerase-like protein (cupin superfamily)
MTEGTATKRFTIFRAKDAPGLMESGIMKMAPMTDTQIIGFKKMGAAGVMDGEEVKILVNLPGFSLAYAWLKAAYPLTLHSHDSDCLYYIVAGTLRIGTEDLGPRDSIFVPAGVPYTYKAGPEGVEVLEFRHETNFNFVNLSKSAAFYDKGAETCSSNRQGWKDAVPPSVNAGPV